MAVSPSELSLDKCAQEAIHIPGSIQPHGVLVVLDPDSLLVVQASANIEARLGLRFDSSSSLSLADFGAISKDLQDWLATDTAFYLRTGMVAQRRVQIIGHRTAQGVILEFEDAPESERETLEGLYPRLAKFVEDAQAATTLPQLCTRAAHEVRRLTSFNRVLIYRFDDQGHGEVIAEDSDSVLPSYLGLRFPASDIPSQARELYRLHRLRLICDANAERVLLNPLLCPRDGAPLNMSGAALRSVSPVHLEYMRNMGTRSSMSISLLLDGELWGLISCHNEAPRAANAQVRTACDLIGKVVSLQIGALERASYATRRIELKQIEAHLLAKLGESSSFQTGLAENPELCLKLADATGAAVVEGHTVIRIGLTPSSEQIQSLAERLRLKGTKDIFTTDSLSSEWPEFSEIRATASGVCAISISQLHSSYIFWFRPEVVRTVNWGGDPRKAVNPDTGRLHHRHSFEVWKEQVTSRARPWNQAEIDALVDFRNSIINFVLRRAEERAELTAQLQRSNRELESFSYSISHDLRAPFRHIVGYTQLLREREKGLSDLSKHYLDSINEAASNAGQLVDDLLNFSHLGRASLSLTDVDVKKVVHEARKMLDADVGQRDIEWHIGSTPPLWGDVALLRQVFVNLLDNAVKYTRAREKAVIEISGVRDQKQCVYTIKDNGVGFDMAYADKLFGVFQRLHRMEDYEGTGIGLALTKRIVDRHRGWISADSQCEGGATFKFGIPVRPEAPDA